MFVFSGEYLRPAVLQLLGIALLLGLVITQDQSALFVGAALCLIGVGSAGGAIVTVKQEITQRAEEHRHELERQEEVKRR